MSDTDHCLHWSGNGLYCCFCGSVFAVDKEDRIVDDPSHGIHWNYRPKVNKQCWVRAGKEFPQGEYEWWRLGR